MSAGAHVTAARTGTGRPPSVLFALPDTGRGGSAISLATALAVWPAGAYDLLVPAQSLLAGGAAAVRRRFPSAVQIHPALLPFDGCFVGAEGGRLPPPMSRAYARTRTLAAALDRARQHRIGRGYDLVHLNSLALNPWLTAGIPCSIHVREIVPRPGPALIARLRRARAIVFIDEATRRPFSGFPDLLACSTVLANPVDMRSVANADTTALAVRIGRPLDQVAVFALLGTQNDDKGTAFIVEQFATLDRDDLLLLVIGDGNRAYLERCRHLAASTRTAVFLPRTDDPMPVLRLADYVLRGEAIACLGRTVSEGLHAGCGVVVPGEEGDRARYLAGVSRFADRVHLYQPRDGAALRAVITALAGRKRHQREFLSNAEPYVAAFHAFLAAAAHRPPPPPR